ncbi:MAG TPA: GPW/gp25 family protein, partial [Candidatus Limnocylindrales bacterium]|nr:GPW/gp25 family protein [Candidatus Limnocylindrales bacterium]
MAHEFVGAGWAFPLKLDATGAFELVTDDREIEQAIRLIIGTAYGERPMRPDFGCRIHDFVFAEANATTAGRIATEVRASLTRWEPRITIDDVVVSGDQLDPSVLYVDVRYHVRNR